MESQSLSMAPASRSLLPVTGSWCSNLVLPAATLPWGPMCVSALVEDVRLSRLQSENVEGERLRQVG